MQGEMLLLFLYARIVIHGSDSRGFQLGLLRTSVPPGKILCPARTGSCRAHAPSMEARIRTALKSKYEKRAGKQLRASFGRRWMSLPSASRTRGQAKAQREEEKRGGQMPGG